MNPTNPSDEEFERNRRRMKMEDLRYEASLPPAAVEWWKLRSKILTRPAYGEFAPSGNLAWDDVYNIAKCHFGNRLERDTGVSVGLVGAHGVGKTVIATGLLLLTTARLRSARYTTLFD